MWPTPTPGQLVAVRVLNVWPSPEQMWLRSRTKWTRNFFCQPFLCSIGSHLLIQRNCATTKPTSSLLSETGMSKPRPSTNTCVPSTCIMCSWLFKWVVVSNVMTQVCCSFKGIWHQDPVNDANGNLIPIMEDHAQEVGNLFDICHNLNKMEVLWSCRVYFQHSENVDHQNLAWSHKLLMKNIDTTLQQQVVNLSLWEPSGVCVFGAIFILHHCWMHHVHHTEPGSQCQQWVCATFKEKASSSAFSFFTMSCTFSTVVSHVLIALCHCWWIIFLKSMWLCQTLSSATMCKTFRISVVWMSTLLRPCSCGPRTVTTTSFPSQEQYGWRQRSQRQHSLLACLLSVNQWVLHLHKSLNLHQLQLQPPWLKARSLGEETGSNIKWIPTNPKMVSHTLASTSADAKSIGAPNVPRGKDGIFNS